MASTPEKSPDGERTDEIPAARPIGKDDQALRDAALSFVHSGDVKKFNGILEAFLKKSNAKCALLIHTGGHIITKVGLVDRLDTDTVGALVSGAFAATKKLFEVFKEKDFALTVQKGKKESVYIGLAGKKTLLTVLFDDTTTQGAIQLYATETTKKLEEYFAAMERGEGAKPGEDDKISDTFGAQSGGALDNVFG
ncbi:MAG: roadblock/LC7 domain-containing protein [Planctomycetaceae bacterium]|nr:roadblock/LC7 domain-containing protein [Planctomycetota bacterium]NUN53606.1 roadblock/LC7 domain-containing protein [Planctomycetaceae bacterium]